MAVIFKDLTKQNRLILGLGVALGFEDEHAEEYFVRMGWAEKTDQEPIFTYPEGSVEIHPLTVFADGPKKGAYVHEERAEAHLDSLEEHELKEVASAGLPIGDRLTPQTEGAE